MRQEKHQGRGREALVALLLVAGLCLLLMGAARWLGAVPPHEETAIPNDCFAVVPASAELPKLACLTFDDGPSRNTEEILRILQEKQAPATFFVTAQEVNQAYMPMISQIAEQGHQIALHSATHEYKTIYQSTAAFWQDIKSLRQTLAAYVDVDQITWLRFPGGSTNTVSHKYGGNGIMQQLIRQTGEKGYHWIDWNVCAEDATRSHPDAAQILKNIQRDAEGQQICVVLMHDTKATGETVKALPAIVDWFREQGYEFCTVAEMDARKNAVEASAE